MVFLIGPCMFVAPLVVVLVPIAIVLWPPTLILLGIVWLLWWPVARLGGAGPRAVHVTLGRWFRTLLTPWTYFDTPAPKAPPQTHDPEKPA